MLCIEFPSAAPADVRGPQAVDLSGAARALLHEGSPFKTLVHRRTLLMIPWDFDANYMTITTPLFPFFKQGTSHIKLCLPVY